ncbi:hypothetical protein SNE40_016552 [Patella caerulea]|uniref:Farnesoic acid O-methyl transferase domain-containing protein n=1 Tax=Patella caerulea TaxID=87958 RepID=A0AAN8J8T2_PATCE
MRITVFIICMELVYAFSVILKVPEYSPYIHFTEVGNNTNWIFFVKACKDGKIGLFSNTDANSAIYEIVFGAGVNTYTVVRKNGNTMGFKYGRHLDCGTFRSFWINWAEKSISVGSGTFVGENILISKADPEQGPIHYLALSTHIDIIGYWMLHSSCAK